MMELLIFYVFAALAVLSSLLVVTIRNTARALFLLFVVLFAMAGLYLFALADFVAITQILIYVGGVLILMIFAFMLSNKELLSDLHSVGANIFSLPAWQSVLIAAGFLAVLGLGIWEWHASMPNWILANIKSGAVIRPSDQNIEQIGLLFMSRYVLPFEVISILLMMALIGASHISRRGGLQE